MRDLLTKTFAYIDTVNEERAKHHRAVVHREVCNSKIALDDMNVNQVKDFDIRLSNRLKRVDSE